MRSIYLLIAFIGATNLFFYMFGGLTEKNFLFGNNGGDVGNPTLNKKQPAGANSTGTKKFFPSNFSGPNGQPAVIGPQGNPPPY